MAAFSSSPAWLCIGGGGRRLSFPAKHALNCVHASVAAGRSFPSKMDLLTDHHHHQNGHASNLKQESRQNIPKEKQLVDPHRQGVIVDGGVVYRQTVVIRSYEVGPDKTATIQTLFSLLQETALNHVWMSGLLSDNGFGATHGMVRNNLIWVVSRIHLQLHQYPIWGEVVEIDTWVGASGKNGMRRDWLLRSPFTGTVFARASSTWVMMNQSSRRLSKVPEEVRAEISPWFTEEQALEEEESPERIPKLDSNATYELSNLKPKRSDLDMNNHVNNIIYVKWMLETIPDELQEDHSLSSIVLEYRRECGSTDLVQSLCEPQDAAESSNGRPGLAHQLTYTHLLQKTTGGGGEILRGKTTWNPK
ncbi:palmitoyl-acyl carrier protein thioesterase, chloroplastic-like [Andrographis paniculata]|uniref:palmitoyl-acyl carrier protein thioesterase, chloroplastic-like n=1 Tax=Andrographis paniculata TaxID=175694 RepID=UPI0021E7A958|nr:palmitoyl-acyl carrier protein thioesterase, chloroplastic-like [Andrographis paniculata]